MQIPEDRIQSQINQLGVGRKMYVCMRIANSNIVFSSFLPRNQFQETLFIASQKSLLGAHVSLLFMNEWPFRPGNLKLCNSLYF